MLTKIKKSYGRSRAMVRINIFRFRPLPGGYPPLVRYASDGRQKSIRRSSRKHLTPVKKGDRLHSLLPGTKRIRSYLIQSPNESHRKQNKGFYKKGKESVKGIKERANPVFSERKSAKVRNS